MRKVDFTELMTTSVASTLEDIKMSNYLFFDIETTPSYNSFDEMSESMQTAWKNLCDKKKSEELKRGDSYNDIYLNNAALMPEVNKIVCLSLARIIDGETLVSSLPLPNNMENDKALVNTFATYLSRQTSFTLVGFNINSFDLPVLFKKCVCYGITLPKQFIFFNVKAWEKQVIDLLDLWKTNNYNNQMSQSLEIVSAYLGLSNPKENVHGGDVRHLYTDGKFSEIIEYCEGDVNACVEIFKKFEKVGLL